ncbi:MAG: hypothetical protein A3F95_00445 [Candidatus Nealsonbacteria bacterium RIFCSPLOWO2_12_FULL_39_31]|uniref:Uncharacterized protein n=3 Tax=Candidatus Nealsoniibacteriota TaxID=1817911 RepID=A0A1G2EFG2_9BACT|nr:MAG: hypothetical protein US88_C0005G0032 [Parcubacteria group bacterium GW2011_GWA2_38_27]KKQ97835.1 MAG: hypothetical protein UT22_C0007G0021 [Parcubacteria group bacterium GW2011_GWC2_39_11]OGZ19282.1 MAG: hypothetical protein A2626_01580 [Candidatus Nealsonbacteria bacterium RIFCSPHIGHO2_01_FULL_38_55]OGZ21385.1 MAG: hypothetical protein A2W55_02600 [Candidatus Nealsonbacteria bacterium RIFCSPHIGHO2_02_38_10]OGZ21794.1 MAG: hypothetical protein A3C48_01060 [Candidatus Nealsonbacteria bac
MRIFRRKTKEEKIQKGIEGLKGNKDGLMLLLRMVSQDPHKTTILSMVLKEENVTLDDLEYLLVLTQKQDILRQIREIILKIGIDPSELLILFLNRTGDTSDWAYEEFLSRINNGIIGRDHAIRILLKVVEEDPPRRTNAWNKIKELRPQKNHLRIMADLEGKIEMNGIAAEAQNLMAKTGKRNALKKVKKIADLIKGQD